MHTFGKKSSRERPTRFHVEESLVACRKAQRLHASGTPLQNDGVVVARVEAPGLIEEFFMKFFGLKKECANYPILTQEVVTGDNKEYWAPM